MAARLPSELGMKNAEAAVEKKTNAEALNQYAEGSDCYFMTVMYFRESVVTDTMQQDTLTAVRPSHRLLAT